jgi:hypothetical protein
MSGTRTVIILKYRYKYYWHVYPSCIETLSCVHVPATILYIVLLDFVFFSGTKLQVQTIPRLVLVPVVKTLFSWPSLINGANENET